MEQQLKQLENKIDLILEYIIQKEKSNTLKNRYQYEYELYQVKENEERRYPNSTNFNQTNTHVKAMEKGYIDSLVKLEKHLEEISSTIAKW